MQSANGIERSVCQLGRVQTRQHIVQGAFGDQQRVIAACNQDAQSLADEIVGDSSSLATFGQGPPRPCSRIASSIGLLNPDSKLALR